MSSLSFEQPGHCPGCSARHPQPCQSRCPLAAEVRRQRERPVEEHAAEPCEECGVPEDACLCWMKYDPSRAGGADP